MTPLSFRQLALKFDNATEQSHFEKTSFRFRGKIFATLDTANKKAALKLPLADQSVYCLIKPVIAEPATGAWGKQGWTRFDLTRTSQTIIREALQKSYDTVAGKSSKKAQSSAKAKTDTIQTLHPDPGKSNKRIAVVKYDIIRKHLLSILRKKEYTHTELMEALYQQVKDSFEGGVQWYGETVKLDLEARKLIERTGKKPDTYRIKK